MIHNGASSSRKIFIGLGSTIGVLALVALAVFLVILRKSAKKKRSHLQYLNDCDLESQNRANKSIFEAELVVTRVSAVGSYQGIGSIEEENHRGMSSVEDSHRELRSAEDETQRESTQDIPNPVFNNS